jgi:hypothetical protein
VIASRNGAQRGILEMNSMLATSLSGDGYSTPNGGVQDMESHTLAPLRSCVIQGRGEDCLNRRPSGKKHAPHCLSPPALNLSAILLGQLGP